jgi:redox-sensitive bicupin YhaK (pirin superfamily)
MDRKTFLKTSALASATLLAHGLSAKPETDNKVIDQVGFNHIPLKKEHSMKNTVLHKADTRGNANHGWLQSYHTFSFANYYNPDRMNFGALRVLNDDTVQAGMGFGTHPHRDREIISIPLEGALEHKDSMGTTTVIRNGDVQVMSAGRGVQHSEYNKHRDKLVKFLQIWVFPRERGVEPRYDQITLNKADRKNKLQQIVSPRADDAGVWLHQDAWFHLGDLDAGFKTTYTLHQNGNGVYAFLLSGKVRINGQQIETRDGYGIWDTPSFELEASENSEILLMEVPMNME